MANRIPFTYRAMTLAELSSYYGRDKRIIYKRWIGKLKSEWIDKDGTPIRLDVDFAGIKDKGYILTPRQVRLLTDVWELNTDMENDLKKAIQ